MISNNYEIRQLTLEDKEQFIKLTADAYFYDSDLQKILDLNYDDCAQRALTFDYDHIIKTGYNYGAFYNNQLVSSMVSFDLTNTGSPQKVQPNEKLKIIQELGTRLKSEFVKQQFLPGEWIQLRFIQTHPDHRGKKLTKQLLEQCHNKWKEHKFKYAYLWATHIASKVLLFSLSKQQFVYASADKLNDQPFYSEVISIKLDYEQSEKYQICVL